MRPHVKAILGVILGASVLDAQATAKAIAPRPLGPIVAQNSATLGSVVKIVPLRGAILINDAASRQVVLLDSSGTTSRVVVDSAAGHMNSYGAASPTNGLFRFRGDSAIWTGKGNVDALIIGPDGKTSRVAAMPTEAGCAWGDGSTKGAVICDRPIRDPVKYLLEAQSKLDDRLGDTTVLLRQDSNYVVAVDFATRRADTLGVFVKRRGGMMILGTRTTSTTATFSVPVAAIDLWTNFRDGTVAIARGQDYHIDIVSSQSMVEHGPRVSFDWRQVTDNEYRTVTDSLRQRDSVQRAQNQGRLDALNEQRRAGGAPPIKLPPAPVYGERSDWPTYWPAFSAGGFFAADEGDRLWLQEQPAPGADTVNVYAVFNRKGEMIDRVKTPRQWMIRGFGTDNTVYLTGSDAGRITLAKAKYREPR